MPLKLRPPRAGRTPFYTIRGTYLGVHIEESTRTSRREIAERLKRKKEREIECGTVAVKGATTFVDAAIDYMEAGGERRFMPKLLIHFEGVPVTQIDQSAIDKAAVALYPNADSPTRNRQVYTPVSAVLKRAGIEREVKRPIGWRGRKLTHWLAEQVVFKVFQATNKIAAPVETRLNFRILLVLLCYTGMRLSDALGLECANVNLKKQSALLPETKNGDPRNAYLPKVVVRELRKLPDGLNRNGRVFRFHKGGRLYDLFAMTLEIAGVVLPRRVAFHVFCHTWATWMREHGKLDTFDLTKTDRWKDQESADRYAHVVISAQSKKAELLPVSPRMKKRAGRARR
jgi:integrase